MSVGSRLTSGTGDGERGPSGDGARGTGNGTRPNDAVLRSPFPVPRPPRDPSTAIAPTRLLIVFTSDRHMSSGRSTAATNAMPAAACAPRPIASRTMRVVTSELPGTPAPANAAAVDARTIESIAPGPSSSPYNLARKTAAAAL